MALGVFAVQESSCPGYRSLDPVEDLKKAILRILLSNVKTDGGNSERPKALDLARDLEPNIDMELRRAAEELTEKDWLIDIQNLEIGEKLASGSSGDLHQGAYLRRDVAIKILNLEDDDILNFNNFSTKELLQMFMQEVSILRLLPSHKNILQFIGAGLCWPRLYIITELMLGDVLQTRESAASCRRPSSVLDPFDSTRWSLKILRDAARGVNFLHRNGIMHRDLKAANLLVDKQGVVKVCDLGLAKPFKAIKPAAVMHADEKPTEISVERSFAPKGPFKGAIKITGILRAKLRKLRGEEDTVNVQTRGSSDVRTKGGKRLGPGVSAKVVPIAQPSSEASNMTGEIGTLKWMSPEVLLHVPYDHKADVYSFGILIWEIYTGEVPYAGLTPLQAASEVVNQGLRPIMPPSVPPKLAHLAQQCWRHNPQERPEFTEIEAILEELSTSLEAQSWASLHTKSGFGRQPKWLCSMGG